MNILSLLVNRMFPLGHNYQYNNHNNILYKILGITTNIVYRRIRERREKSVASQIQNRPRPNVE